jgi:L-galactose dehydrogenase
MYTDMPAAPDITVMPMRRLGRTDLLVSLLSFGASPLGNIFRVTDPEEGKRAIHMAIAHGINFFDVSPYYGLTLAEQRLGEAIVGHRDKIVLATKCGRYGADDFDFSARRVYASIDESLSRLRTDHVDLLQVHDVEFGNVQQIIDETIPAMRRLQEQGKARYIGITGYPLKTLVRIAEAVPVDTILTYCRYNLMITDMDDILTPVARKHNIGLINASALHMGILAEGDAPAWHPAGPQVRAAGKRAAELCRQRGEDISTVALRFCLDHSYVSTTLVGMSTRKQVTDNLRVLSAGLDSRLREEIADSIAPVFNYVWQSGRLENEDCQPVAGKQALQ